MLLGVGAIAVLGAMLVAWRSTDRLADDVRREMAILDAARPVTPDSRTAARLLADLSAQLEACAPPDAQTGAPWKWDPALDVPLRAEIGDLQPWFDAADACAAHPAIQRVLAQRGWTQMHDSLEATRNRSNVLCARAVLDARDGRDADSGRRIGQAIDLTSVGSSRGMVGMMIGVLAQFTALDALRHVVDAKADVRVLLATLDPALARCSDASVLVDAVRADTLDRLTGSRADLLDPRSWPLAFDVRRQARGWVADLRAIEAAALRDGAPEPMVVESKSLFDVRRHQQGMIAMFVKHARRAELARLALRVAAFHDEHSRWPASLDAIGIDDVVAPANAGSYAYTIDPDGGVTLFADVGSDSAGLGVWKLR